MEYVIGVRIVFPEEIAGILKGEKDRFATEFGSKYKTEPHITLYRHKSLDGDFLVKSFSGFLADLQNLNATSFTFSLLAPKMLREEDRHRNFYLMDVSGKECIQDLAARISAIAAHHGFAAYPIDPHITLGAIDFDLSQANFEDIRKNLHALVGKEITLKHIVVVLDGKKEGEEKFRCIERILVPLQPER